MSKSTPRQRHLARARRTNTVARLSGRPRLLINRSNKAIYAQVIDDAAGTTLCGASSLKLKESGIAAAEAVGKRVAEMAKKHKVKEVTFDRNGYKYHGQVKALADGARAGGLTF